MVWIDPGLSITDPRPWIQIMVWSSLAFRLSLVWLHRHLRHPSYTAGCGWLPSTLVPVGFINRIIVTTKSFESERILGAGRTKPGLNCNGHYRIPRNVYLRSSRYPWLQFLCWIPTDPCVRMPQKETRVSMSQINDRDRWWVGKWKSCD